MNSVMELAKRRTECQERLIAAQDDLAGAHTSLEAAETAYTTAVRRAYRGEISQEDEGRAREACEASRRTLDRLERLLPSLKEDLTAADNEFQNAEYGEAMGLAGLAQERLAAMAEKIVDLDEQNASIGKAMRDLVETSSQTFTITHRPRPIPEEVIMLARRARNAKRNSILALY